MKPILSARDKCCISRLIERGLFSKITIEKLEIGRGIIVAPCSDGDQFDDVYSHIANVCKEAVATNRIHPVALNGGAILMSNQLSEEQNMDGEIMFRNILKASEIKEIEDVFLYTHFPCAIARVNGLGVIDQGNLLMTAKNRLKKERPNLRIKCFFHIDMYDEVEGNSHKRRTYFVSKELWKEEALLLILHELKSVV